MLFCNLKFFLARIAGQLDDLHAVEQWPRDGIERIGCRDEQHVGEIERHLDKMVAERVVLLRVEHLQKRRGRVAAVIVSELVDLVEQHQRIAATGKLHCVHDPSGHRADICLAMAADIALIAHAAK